MVRFLQSPALSADGFRDEEIVKQFSGEGRAMRTLWEEVTTLKQRLRAAEVQVENQSKQLKLENKSLTPRGAGSTETEQSALPPASSKPLVEVRVFGAEGLRKARLLSTMDPFCSVSLGGVKRKSHTAKDGDTRPRWDETLAFKRVGLPRDRRVVVEVWDDGLWQVEIGRGELPLQLSDEVVQRVEQGECLQLEAWVDLTNERQPAGRVHVQVTINPRACITQGGVAFDGGEIEALRTENRRLRAETAELEEWCSQLMGFGKPPSVS